ncbi:MAG: DUF2240 family protein [Methanobacteriota archaeon]|nr:MAG: DUF2240 family protein [Euryarchaeota archaeon]
MSLKVAIAAPFKHTKKDALQKAEFIFYIAIEKKWMNRDQVERLLERAKEERLVEYAGGVIRPLFDVGEITIPLGFKPASTILDEDDPTQVLLQRIAVTTHRTPQEVAGEMNQLIREGFDGSLRAEAAAVLLAKRYRVPFDDLLDRLTARIAAKKKGS